MCHLSKYFEWSNCTDMFEVSMVFPLGSLKVISDLKFSFTPSIETSDVPGATEIKCSNFS